MKTIYLFFLILLVNVNYGNAQEEYFAFNNSLNIHAGGAISLIQDGGFDRIYEFIDKGDNPSGNLIELNNKIYGTGAQVIGSRSGYLFSYDLILEQYNIEYTFNKIGSDEQLVFEKIVTDGTKYIYAFRGPHFILGGKQALIRYEPNNNEYETLVDLGVLGIEQVTDLLYLNDSVYGISRDGGVDDIGVLFSYNISDDEFIIHKEFTLDNPYRSKYLVSHSNGNIYGTLSWAGENGYGAIFQFDTTTNEYTNLFHFTSSQNGDNLTEGDDGYFYGWTKPISGGEARIYKYDIQNNDFENLVYFSSEASSTRDFYPELIYNDDYLYGIFRNQRFSYNLSENHFTSVFVEERGTSDLTLIENNIYSLTDGLPSGKMIKHNINLNVYNEIFTFGSDGYSPTKMIVAQNNYIYGIVGKSQGTVFPNGDDDRVFKLNPTTLEYSITINTALTDYGSYPSDIIENEDGMLYIGFNYSNKIVEYNPKSGEHSSVYNFNDITEGNGSILIDDVFKFKLFQNKLYDERYVQGEIDQKNRVIYSFDTVSKEYLVEYEFLDDSLGDLDLISSSGKIYGYSNVENDLNYIFVYDVTTGEFSKIFEFNDNISNLTDNSLFYEVENGGIYGYLPTALSEDGVIFSIDPYSNEFQLEYVFNHEELSTGFTPFVMESSGNSLYLATSVPNGAFFTNDILLRFDTVEDEIEIIDDFDGFGTHKIDFLFSKVGNDIIGNIETHSQAEGSQSYSFKINESLQQLQTIVNHDSNNDWLSNFVLKKSVEICDGIDNNDDGEIDEGVLTTFYEDADDDGFGDPNSSILSCSIIDGYVQNNSDNCINVSNTDQIDNDNDNIGDLCDPDDDNDGTLDEDDAFPLDPNEDNDTDQDGIGNNADTDDDNDGYSDTIETACADTDPFDNTSIPEDNDSDLDPDCSDPDDDNDGTSDEDDAFPLDPNEDTDTDQDGIGNNADPDDDNDGFSDDIEADCSNTDPLDSNSIPIDNDSDLDPDCSDTDDDNDGSTDDEEIACGSDPLDGEEDCASLSVENVDKVTFIIHPNPVRQTLNIESLFQNNLDITIYDLTGRVILSTKNTIIDVSRLKAGSYLIQLKDGNKQQMKQFVKY